MSKKLLDSSESSDEEVPQINVNTDFAHKYENWRRKEELQKLKDKYGDNLDILSDSEQSFVSGSGDGSDKSDSESEESVGSEEQVFDENFFKVYSALKCKNPVIYDKNFKFFNQLKNDGQNEDNSAKKTKKKEKTMTLIDYHTQLIKQKKGITDEDLQQMNGREDKSVGYYEELNQIKNEFKTIINSDEGSAEELFKGKSQSVSPQKEKVSFLDKKEVQNDSDINYLKNYWKNEKQLEESEKYLKDYILNKRYVDNTEEESELYLKPNPNERKVSESDSSNENEINNGFETIDDINNKDKDIDIKISDFHFEEPDALSLKRFPRNIETIRDTTTSDKRALKRSETKERKKREKERELKRLRKWKKEELKQKLAKLQEISGNDQMDFNDLDLNIILDDDKDFDSEKYDQKMEALFGSDYYLNEKTGSKPKFEYMPEIDDYECEDIHNKDNEGTNGKKSKLLIKKEKKINKTMEEIGIFEDLIGGDLPTRFKYRSVESNDFGLTNEEILFGDDKELNKWCSLKKMSQYRDDNEEIYDKKSYSLKAKDINLKQKILKSFYEKEFPEQNNNNNEENASNLETNNDNNSEELKKKRKKRRHKKPMFTIEVIGEQNGLKEERKQELNEEIGETVKKSKNSNRNKKFKPNKRHNKQKAKESPYPGVSVERLKAYGLSNRKIKKIKHKTKQ